MAAAAKPERTGRAGGGLTWLLIGVILGVLGTIFLPRLAGPYLPDGLRGEAVQVAGIVEAKSTAGERLLLTVASEAGATLVTFREDVAEIDLLVGVGDSVLLAVDEYAPFVDDADIRRVMKRRDWKPAARGPTGAADTVRSAEQDTAADSARLGVDTSRARLDTTRSAEGDTTAREPADGAPPAQDP